MNPVATIITVFAALAVLFYFVNMNNQKTAAKIEMMENYQRNMAKTNGGDIMSEDPLLPQGGVYNVVPSQPMGQNETNKEVQPEMADPNNAYGLNGNQFPNDCFPKDQLNPAELLPGNANSTWAQVAPNGQGELGDMNFLSAGYHTGINTVGSSMRNPNLGLRSEPPNPVVQVSPWMQSTISPDLSRRGLEIGN